MPKYYCDYCDTFLTHDSPSVRKTHCQGRKHKDNVKYYYQKWMEEQAQHLIDATTAAFKAGKMGVNPYSNKVVLPPVLPPPQANIPSGHPQQPVPMHGPPPPGPRMHPGQMGPMMMGPHGPVPPMMGMRPPMVGPMMQVGPMGPMGPMAGPPMMGPGRVGPPLGAAMKKC